MKLTLHFAIYTATIIISHMSVQSTDDSNHENKLRAVIAANLTEDVQSRPIQSQNNVTNIDVFILLTHVVGLDEKTETLTVSGWLYHWWTNEHVTWDPVKFGGIKRIILSADSMWKPKFVLLNSASFVTGNEMFGPVSILASHTGYIQWSPPFTIQSICSLDLRWFPFDEHECVLMFGGWHSNLEVNFTIDEYWKENFVARFADIHNEWQLLKTTAEKKVLYQNYEYPTYNFNIHLRRRATYYHYLFILPLLIGIFLCLVIFLLPADIKFISSSFNIFLLTLFVSHVYWVVPRSGSSVPNIVIVTGNTLALAAVAMLFSIITTTLSHGYQCNPPAIITSCLSGWLGVILCLRPINAKSTVAAKIAGSYSADSMQMQVNEQSAKRPIANVDAWIQLAIAVDRILFTIYCVTFFVMFLITFS